MSGGSMLDIVEDVGGWEVFAGTWTFGGQSQEVFLCRHLVQQTPQAGLLQVMQQLH